MSKTELNKQVDGPRLTDNTSHFTFTVEKKTQQ